MFARVRDSDNNAPGFVVHVLSCSFTVTFSGYSIQNTQRICHSLPSGEKLHIFIALSYPASKDRGRMATWISTGNEVRNIFRSRETGAEWTFAREFLEDITRGQ